MSVAENESTARAASQGVGVDAIANPISGVAFPEGAAFSGPVTASSTVIITGSANFSQLTVSGNFRSATSGAIAFLMATSGGAAAGSGASISGLVPQGFITIVVSGAVGRIPYFN